MADMNAIPTRVRKVRVTITGTYEVSEADLRDGGVYVDEKNPGPITWDEALEIDRKNLREGRVNSGWEWIDDNTEQTTLEWDDE